MAVFSSARQNEQNNSADVTENTQADANQRDKDKTFGKTVLNEKLGGLVSFGLEPTSNSKIKYTFVGTMCVFSLN